MSEKEKSSQQNSANPKKGESVRSCFISDNFDFEKFRRSIVERQIEDSKKSLQEILTPLISEFLQARLSARQLESIEPEKYFDPSKMTWEEYRLEISKHILKRFIRGKNHVIYEANISNLSAKIDIHSTKEFKSLIQLFDSHISDFTNQIHSMKSKTAKTESKLIIPENEAPTEKSQWFGTVGQLGYLLNKLSGKGLIERNCNAFGERNFEVKGKPVKGKRLSSDATKLGEKGKAEMDELVKQVIQQGK